MKRRKFINFLRKTGLIRIVNKLVNLKYKSQKKKALAKGESDIDVVYDKKFFLENIDVTEESARKFAEIMIDYFNPKKIIDFGSGPGVYIKEFDRKGISVLGVDGSQHAIDNAVVDKDKIILRDLRKPVDIESNFDLTICFEVAEHIETSASEMLVRNITRNSDLVLFTAARKGQGGTDHINEQDPEFWINIFKKHGFEIDKDLTAKIKKRMIDEKIVWWIPENLMIFKRV